MTRSARSQSSAEIEAVASDWVIRRELGLSESEQREFSRWLASDPRHADAMTRHNQAWALLDRPRSTGTASKMALDLSRRATRRRRRVRSIAAIASVFLLAAVVWLERPSTPRPSVSPSARITVPQRQTLSDGSEVDLKDDAEISIDFSGPLRRVRLVKGEAYFQVAKNRERPFVVTADGLDVKAVGTEFAVGLNNALVDVIVTEGKVSVIDTPPLPGSTPTESLAPNQTRPTGLSTSLEAGKRLIVHRSSSAQAPRVVEMTIAEMADRLAWRIARLEFSQTPLSEAVTMLNQRSKTQIIIEDSQLGKTPVSGIFRVDNTDTLIRLLEENFGVKAEKIGDNVVLRRTR